MANPLERAATRRKVWYLAAIVGLFTVSLFWRGTLAVPFGNPARAADQAPTALNRYADRLSNLSVASRAERLELRELDQGDQEVVGTVARLSLLGSRGVVVTLLWRTAIEKQKRHEWTQFEMAARAVTRLQPNFLTPWLFQGWNIAYNVSVENDKLGDSFFYIARGIELLTEGDRLNTRSVGSRGYGDRKVGFPDIRYSIGFFYQNKFGVSDKVNTLRSLMQVAAVNPRDRDPKMLMVDGKLDGRVDPKAFREFCERNPQLVRRLREQVFVDAEQKNPYATPELVVRFLADNADIPTRWTPNGELKPRNDRYPALPPVFEEGPDEFNPDTPTDDTFDAFHAARAWFRYAISTIPPPKKGPDGRPIPWANPAPTDYDQFVYRMPRSPAYIIFRQSSPRSQTYLAERLAKEGWFDGTSTWNPDERSDKLWFKRTPADPDVFLKTPASAREEWQRAFLLWQQHAAENALLLDDATYANFAMLAGRVPGDPNSLPHADDFPPEKMEAYRLTQANIDAKKSLIYYHQNRQITNFAYFFSSGKAEQDPITVGARKLLFRAAANKKYGSNAAAIRDYVAGLALWRDALTKYPDFHRPERSTTVEEQTFEYEVELTKLLRDDGQVLARANAAAAAAGALFPALTALAGEDIEQATAEREAGLRVVALDPQVQDAIRQAARKRGHELFPNAHHALLAAVGPAGMARVGEEGLVNALGADAATEDLALQVAGSPQFDWKREFMREPPKTLTGNYLPTDSDYWVSPMVRRAQAERMGLKQPAAPAAEASQPPGEAPPGAQPATTD